MSHAAWCLICFTFIFITHFYITLLLTLLCPHRALLGRQLGPGLGGVLLPALDVGQGLILRHILLLKRELNLLVDGHLRINQATFASLAVRTRIARARFLFPSSLLNLSGCLATSRCTS